MTKCHDHINKLNSIYVKYNLLLRELQKLEEKMKKTLDSIALDSELFQDEIRSSQSGKKKNGQ